MEHVRDVAQALGVTLDDARLAARLDASDELAKMRGEFNIPSYALPAADWASLPLCYE